MAQETYREIDKEYLETQFRNFATRIALVFAQLTDVPKSTEDLSNNSGFITLQDLPIMEEGSVGVGKPDGISIKVDKDGTMHAVVEGGTMDYESLVNLPKINGVKLTGEKSLHDLGIQAEGDYLTESALEDYSVKDETGYSLGLTMDPKTFVITIELKTKSGETLSTQEIDLPLESAVIGGSLNEDGTELTLTLQNGTTLPPIQLSKLLVGLVSQDRTIAGIDLKDDISKEELQSALDVPNIVEETDNIDFSTFFTD